MYIPHQEGGKLRWPQTSPRTIQGALGAERSNIDASRDKARPESEMRALPVENSRLS